MADTASILEPDGLVYIVSITKDENGNPVTNNLPIPVELQDLAVFLASLGSATTVTAANITDATATGRSVLTATDAAAARTAIGAGTSSLTLGGTASTAMAGNATPTPGTGTVTNTHVSASAAIALSKLANVAAGTDGLAAGTIQATFQALATRIAALETP